MPTQSAEFRFYGELNDYLPRAQRKTTIDYGFQGSPGVKDAIEALGVAHTEVDLILVDGRSVGFDHKLRDRTRVAVYPLFESLDTTPLHRLLERPLRRSPFVLDVHLGKLARRLRLLGIDALYRNDYSDAEIVQVSRTTGRIVLTRDRRLLYAKAVTHGYWVRSTDPDVQTREVLLRFGLQDEVRPFSRCLDCNGCIEPVDKAEVLDQLEPLTRKYYDDFHRCTS